MHGLGKRTRSRNGMIPTSIGSMGAVCKFEQPFLTEVTGDTGLDNSNRSVVSVNRKERLKTGLNSGFWRTLMARGQKGCYLRLRVL